MEDQPPPIKSCLAWLCVVLMALFAAAVLFQTTIITKEEQPVTATLSHLKDIDTALFQYAVDNNGRLPFADKDGRAFANSNEAFRVLFQEGYLRPDDESLFEVPFSPAQIDNYTGQAPDYVEALKPGECHWAMVKGGRYDDPGPLVWENSVSGGWNPVWDPTLKMDKPGRTWSGARIIVLTQGHALKPYKLADPKAPSHLQNQEGKTTNIFTEVEAREVLDPVGLK